MARRSASPTTLVVDYFMTGDLVAVEQALVIATAIITNRRARETSVGLTAPARRQRVRVARPTAAARAMDVVQTGTAPGAIEPTPPPPVTTTTTTPKRKRGRPALVTPPGAEPKRRRRRGTTGATPPMGTGTTSAAHGAPVSELPPQLVEGDEGYEPISTVVE